MPGTWFGLEIAKRGTMAHQKAMDVTGHNIANASTPGYSRQEAVIKPTDPWTLPGLETRMLPGQLGTGSEVTEVRRIRDSYLDVQARQSSSYEAYWQKKLDMANEMENLFPEPDGQGIQESLTTFFNDWQDLNNNPTDSGIKKAVKESGDEVAATFRQLYQQLTQIEDGFGKDTASPDASDTSLAGYQLITDGSINYAVDQANTLVEKISELSDKIYYITRNDAQPNDLLDERDQLIDELAQYGTVEIQPADTAKSIEDGPIVLKFMGQEVLNMNGNTATVNKLTLCKDTNQDYYIQFGQNNPPVNITAKADHKSTDPVSGQGSILGLESSRQEYKTILGKLDDLAENIITNVNSQSGLTFYTGNGAADIALSSDINDHPENIIGENALAVAQLSSGSTILDDYSSIVAEVGAYGDHHENMLENQQAIGDQVESLRQSVSGVLLDEELTRVIQYQYGYQACARMISTQDEMLDYLINQIR